MLKLLMYRSDLCPLMRTDPQQLAAGLADIERTAKARNTLLAVTGVLIVDQGHFVQILEGPSDALDTLMTRIESDDRHSNVTILLDEPIRARAFDEWNMDVFVLDGHADLLKQELVNFRDRYLANEQPNGAEIARWVKRMIRHPEIRFG